MLHDERRGVVEETAHLLLSIAGPKAEIDAAMNAAVAEMTIERGVVIVGVEQLAEFAQVISQALRRDACVLEPFPSVRVMGHERRAAKPRLARLPDELLLVFVFGDFDVRRVRAFFERGVKRPGLLGCFLFRLSAKLGDQPSAASGAPEIATLDISACLSRMNSMSLSSIASRPIGPWSRTKAAASPAW